MSRQETCDNVLLMQADFDGELDPVQSAAMQGHRQTCLICQEAWQTLERARHGMRQQASYHLAPEMLKQRLVGQLAQAGLAPAATIQPIPPIAARLASWWRSLIGFGLGAAVATAAVTLFFQPVPVGDMADLVAASHVRSLQPGHLLDVASNDQHNVKPWFDGKLDFAPPVKNLADQGFPLEGGRLDYLQDREVAALIYRSGQHRINLLVWPASGGAADGTETPELSGKGSLNILHWREKDMTAWAVSDLSADDLKTFVTIWRRHE
jgi:anti-sigma factor RsiW